jgi:hypothetical protein
MKVTFFVELWSASEVHMKEICFFKYDVMRRNICINYLSVKMSSDEKSLNNKVYISTTLQFWYKVYLHPSSYKKIMLFWKQTVKVGVLQYPR